MAHRAFIAMDQPFWKPFPAEDVNKTYWFAMFQDDAAVNPRKAQGRTEIAVIIPENPTPDQVKDAVVDAVVAVAASEGWNITAARCTLPTFRKGN